MKKILLIITVITLLLACNNNKKRNESQAAINGKFKNTTIKSVIVSYDSNTDTISLSDDKSFSAYLNITSPQYATVEIGNKRIYIYISPKADISFDADFKNIDKSIRFSGGDSDINNYIYKQNYDIYNLNITPENFPYNSANHTLYIDAVENLTQKMVNNLSNLEKASKGRYNDFVHLEKQRIIIIEALLILNYYLQGASTEGNEKLNPKLDEILSKLDINNSKITEIKEFRNFAPLLAVYHLNNKILTENYIIKNPPKGFLDAYFEIIPEISESNEVLDEIYYTILLNFMEEFEIEYSNNAYEKYKSFSTNKERIDSLEKIRFEYIKLNPGMPSVDFSFPDINDKIHSLKDFKGKYIYIDIWASWCGPCRAEIPYLKSLKEKFKSKNIEIIGISVDDNKTQWEGMVKLENLDGIQLYAGGWNNPLCNYFKVKGIPRFILLDKNGYIISADTERPSGNIESILNSLEGI